MKMSEGATSEEDLAGASAGGRAAEAGSVQSLAGAEAAGDINQTEAGTISVLRQTRNAENYDRQMDEIEIGDARSSADSRDRTRKAAEAGLMTLIKGTGVGIEEMQENSRFGFNLLYPAIGNLVSDLVAAEMAKLAKAAEEPEE